MAWLISNALMRAYENSRSSPELVEASLLEKNLAGDVSVPSKTIRTPLAYCAPDRMTEFSRLSRYGATFERLTDDRGVDVLTWFRGAFRAKISASREGEQELPESGADSGWKWRESSVKYDPATSLWRTRQHLLLGDLEWFSETWPRWGTMRNGECWELPMSERPIVENGSGLLPTLTVKGNYNRKGVSAKSGDGLATFVGGNLSPMWAEWFMGFPLQHTALDASVTHRSHNAPPKRSGS